MLYTLYPLTFTHTLLKSRTNACTQTLIRCRHACEYTCAHLPTHTHTLQETYLNKRVAHRQTVHLIKMSLICKQCIHLQEQQCNDTDEGLNTHQNHRFVSWQVCECVLCLCSLFVHFVFSLADVHYMHKLKCEVRFFLQDDKLKVRQMKKMSCVENRSVIRPTKNPIF